MVRSSLEEGWRRKDEVIGGGGGYKCRMCSLLCGPPYMINHSICL